MYLFTGIPKPSYPLLKQWSKLANFETIRLAVMSLTYEERICLKSCLRILDLNALKVFGGLKADYQIIKLIIKNDEFFDLSEKYSDIGKVFKFSLSNILKAVEFAEFKLLGELSGESFNMARRGLVEFSSTNMTFQGLPTSEKKIFKTHLNTVIDGLERVEKVFQNVRDLLKISLN